MTEDAVEAAWSAITHARAALVTRSILDLFAADSGRVEAMTKSACGLRLDISKQRLDARALDALQALAAATDVAGWRARLFAGEAVNHTEGRPALHMALRGAGPFQALGVEVSGEVASVRARMAAFADAFGAGQVLGATGQPITALVHIGIGGSDLGPRLLAEALKPQRRPGLTLRFASNVDGADIVDALEGLNPETTALVVVSKTFTTQETMANANAARAWLQAALGEDVGAHLCAVSSAPARASAWGVAQERVFPFWDWVGGRYSLWSAVGLSVACVSEAGAFDALLAGAAAMDAHFRDTPAADNLPILSALAQTWNRVTLGMGSTAVIPYSHRLRLLAAFLQQLEMESNGKGVTRDGHALEASACGITWGEPGTNAQHSFFQLLHQGHEVIPVEFLLVEDGAEGPPAQRAMLLANVLAQAEALLAGKTEAQALAELKAQGLNDEAAAVLAPHKSFPGDRPSTLIGLDRLSPHTIGALLAFYEHRTFVQAVLMGINPFDQWGVELGKQLANAILPELEGQPAARVHDPSTAAWIGRLRSAG